MTVSDLGERALIDRLRARVPAPPAWTIIGIGDDAAVVEPERGELDVLTTDTLVEDVHFRRAWTDPASIGRKSVVVNLSDVAAMGAAPRAVLLSLCLPSALPVEEFDALIDGVAAESAAAGAALVGGNIAQSPGPLVITVTATGSVRRRRVMTRAGGRPGDELYVTGAIGAAAAGLAMLGAGADRAALPPAQAECVARYERPVARVRCGRLVAAARAASACMDLSDGLADAVRQVAEASHLGAVLDAGRIPVHPGAADWFGHQGLDPVAASLAGGEDYELLFAVPPRRRRAFLAAVGRCSPLQVTRIGALEKGGGAFLQADAGRLPLGEGYQHFRDK